MPEDTPMPPKAPKPPGKYDPVDYDYGTGKRITTRRKLRSGEPQPLADGWDDDPTAL
jgi:hypothetical protein